MVSARLKRRYAPPIWRAVSRTWRLRCRGEDVPGDEGPVIFACLHRDILAAIAFCRPLRPALLVSKSDDGQILIDALAADGFRFVRGSTGHDGREGYVGLLRELEAGHHVGLAVDGPRGPFGHIHRGVLQLARRAGVPIVPLTVAGRGCLQLATWDRTLVPLPGALLRVTVGAPLRLDPDAAGAELTRVAATLAASLGVQEGEA